MNKILSFWAFTLAFSPLWTSGQCFFLRGHVSNGKDKAMLSATFAARKDNRRNSLGKSDGEGGFSIQIPCNSTELIIEKLGFRPVTLNISGMKGSYFVNFELFPVDKQVIDRPYFQSEQRDLILDSSDSVKTGKKATRNFRLVDVQTKALVKGNVCLYYTQKNDTLCFDTGPGAENAKVIFDQEDIIGIVVKAAGYQPYNGNLIIDKIDNSTQVYEIEMSRTISIVAFAIETNNQKQALKREIVDQKGRSFPSTNIDNLHGFASVKTGASYILRVFTEKAGKSTEQLIPKVTGLHLITFHISADSVEGKNQRVLATPETLSAEDLSNPFSIRIIYFDKTKYELNKEVHSTLDSIASWLSHNPAAVAQIIGFTDDVGDKERNVALSEYRALVTRHYLFNRGVSERQLRWLGMGSERPVVPNDHEKTRRLNRRVEIKISM